MREIERARERNIDVTMKHWLVAFCRFPWPGMEPTTLQCTNDVQSSEPLQLDKKYLWSFWCQEIFSLDFYLASISTVNYKCFNWCAFLFCIVDAITSQENSNWFPPQISPKCFHFCLTNIYSSIKRILFCLRLFELGFRSLCNGKNPSKHTWITGIFEGSF